MQQGRWSLVAGRAGGGSELTLADGRVPSNDVWMQQNMTNVTDDSVQWYSGSLTKNINNGNGDLLMIPDSP